MINFQCPLANNFLLIFAPEIEREFFSPSQCDKQFRICKRRHDTIYGFNKIECTLLFTPCLHWRRSRGSLCFGVFYISKPL
jgi:hypothetical protein